MPPWGISPVSICFYNACQREIGFKTALGDRRHVHKEAVCLKPCACVKKRLSGGGWEMATFEGSFFFPSLAKFLESARSVFKVVMCVCECFSDIICAQAHVPHPRQHDHLLLSLFHSPSTFIFPPFSPLYDRNRFFVTLWCRISGLKSRVAVLICHVNLLTSVSAATHNCAADDTQSLT